MQVEAAYKVLLGVDRSPGPVTSNFSGPISVANRFFSGHIVNDNFMVAIIKGA